MVDLELPALLGSLVRTAAAAIAMAAVLDAVGTRDLSLSGWIVGGVGGAAAYLAMLLVTRELSVAPPHGRCARPRCSVPSAVLAAGAT